MRFHQRTAAVFCLWAMSCVLGVGCQQMLVGEFTSDETGETVSIETTTEFLLTPESAISERYGLELLSVSSTGAANLRITEGAVVRVNVGDAIPAYDSPRLVIMFSDPYEQTVLVRVRDVQTIAVAE